MESAWEFVPRGARLSATTLRPAPMGRPGPRSSAARAAASGPHTAAEQKLQGKRRAALGSYEWPGWVGGKRKTTPAGGGDRTSLSRGHAHTGTDLCLLSLSGQIAPGQPGLRAGGGAPGEGGLSQHRCRTPAQHGGSEMKLPHGFPPHTRGGQLPPLTGR